MFIARLVMCPNLYCLISVSENLGSDTLKVCVIISLSPQMFEALHFQPTCTKIVYYQTISFMKQTNKKTLNFQHLLYSTVLYFN